MTDGQLRELNKSIIKLLFKIHRPVKDLELADIQLRKGNGFISYIGYRFYCYHLQSFYIKKIKDTEFRYAIPDSVNKCGKSFIGKNGKFMVYADETQLLEISKMFEE